MEMLNMNLFASALAEGTAQLNLTPDEAAAVGAILGFGIGATVMVLVLLFVLQAIADWGDLYKSRCGRLEIADSVL